MDFISEKEANK